MSEKVAIYGYDQWRMRGTAVNAVKTAIAHGGSSYCMPYWEPNVGPYVQVDEDYVGQGDVRLIVLSGNEVYWEAGAEFETSPWWATERARVIQHVTQTPGYIGGKLAPNATTSDIPTDRRPSDNMVMVTEYFERPCPKYPRGRWLTISDGKVIVDARLIDPRNEQVWQDYPLKDPDGTVLDEPLIHRLVYTHDPDDDDDLGLTWQLIDFQRMAQDCINKMGEYKNRGLNLQMLAPVNSLINQPDDVPNSVRYYKLSPNGEKPEWEDPPSAQILNALLQIFNVVLDQMNRVASYEDVQRRKRTSPPAPRRPRSNSQWPAGNRSSATSRNGGRGSCATACCWWPATTRNPGPSRSAAGWAGKASRTSRARTSWARPTSASGRSSFEYLTKNQIMAKVQYYASMGWITGTQAIAAIEGGMAEKLTEGYDQDVAKVNRIINRIRDGSVMDMPTRQEQRQVPDPHHRPDAGHARRGPDLDAQ